MFVELALFSFDRLLVISPSPSRGGSSLKSTDIHAEVNEAVGESVVRSTPQADKSSMTTSHRSTCLPPGKRRKVVHVEEPMSRTIIAASSNGPFASLLPELLELVLSYLSVVDKGRAVAVCRHWRRVCYSRYLWEKEEAKLDLQQTTKQTLRSIHDRGITRIQVLSYNASFTSVTRTFSNLQCLRLTGCYNTTNAILRKAFSSPLVHLKQCDLSLCKQVKSRGGREGGEGRGREGGREGGRRRG